MSDNQWKTAYRERVQESTERLLRIQKLEKEKAELKAKERKYFLDRIEAVESLPINKWKEKFPDFYSWLLQEGFVYKEEFDKGQCKSEIENLRSNNAELKAFFERKIELVERQNEKLVARWEELKEYIKEKFIPLLDKPDDMRRLVRFRREIIRFMEQLESGGNDFESARDKHSVAGVRDCPANSLSKLPKPELEKKGMK